MKRPINMIDQMNHAWKKRNELSHEEFEVHFKNLMSHGFVAVEKDLMDFCRREGYSYDNELFFGVRRILTYLMFCDDDFLQGEYDAYVKYCKWAKFNPLSVESLRSNYNKLTNEAVLKDIRLILAARDNIDPDDYAAFVLSLCYVCLMGDKAMDENEYYILRCFYEDGFDYAPSTWEQFKREW